MNDLESMPLGRLLSAAGAMTMEHWRRTMERHGFGGADSTVLEALPDDRDLSQRQVAEHAWLSPASVSQIADRLEAEGYVERIRDVEDRRIVRLRITEKGRQLRAESRRVIREEFAAVFPALDPADEEVVRRFLARAIRGLSTERGPDDQHGNRR